MGTILFHCSVVQCISLFLSVILSPSLPHIHNNNHKNTVNILNSVCEELILSQHTLNQNMMKLALGLLLASTAPQRRRLTQLPVNIHIL